MKKLLCFLLILTMTAALGAPALAAGMDGELEDVTLRVKETLDVSDEYGSFSGSWDDWLNGSWSLYWSDDDSSLSVTADAGGKVLECWRYDNGSAGDRFYGFDPRFPAMDEAEAERRAGEQTAQTLARSRAECEQMQASARERLDRAARWIMKEVVNGEWRS